MRLLTTDAVQCLQEVGRCQGKGKPRLLHLSGEFTEPGLSVDRLL